MKEFVQKHAELLKEIIRFLIVGGIATLADLGAYSLVFYVFFQENHPFSLGIATLDWRIVTSTIVGFTVGVIINYVMSIFFVFQNVANRKKSRSVLGFIAFVILGLIGLLINIGIKQAGNAIILLSSNVWWNLFVFALATGVVLIYNYLSRKLLLFKPQPQANKIEHEDYFHE
ncbi:MAG: GtrA family protein [Bacilli bacterium]|jgi:putative flippase GtrA